MARVEVYGSSDDILVFQGDIYDETYPDESFKVLVSDGTLIKGYYDGDWNLSVDVIGKCKTTRHPKASAEAERITGRDYSDVIVIEGDFDWVAPVSKIFKVKK